MEKEKVIPIIIALGAAILATGYYILSGRSSFDSSIRDVSNESRVASVEAKNQKLVEITCKDGRSYQITFDDGETSYDDLIFSNCGDEDEEAEVATQEETRETVIK
jgi:hypothetical protein